MFPHAGKYFLMLLLLFSSWPAANGNAEFCLLEDIVEECRNTVLSISMNGTKAYAKNFSLHHWLNNFFFLDLNRRKMNGET